MDNNGYSEQMNEFLDNLEQKMSPEEKQQSEQMYESWKQEGQGMDGRLSDLELAKFMSERLGNITEIIQKSDELTSRDGRVTKRETETQMKIKNDENLQLRKEVEELKGDIKELKELLINKLS